jgi:DNA invertase Pin-like site-specific DNA recombinase
MKYGYARVSTDDQSPASQLAALKKAGCKTVFKDEGLSGATTKRPALLRCLKKLEHGDTLIVWKLDRLGRSLRELMTMLDDIRAHGVKFHSLTEAIDTATPTGRAMWQMIGVLAMPGAPSVKVLSVLIFCSLRHLFWLIIKDISEERAPLSLSD